MSAILRGAGAGELQTLKTAIKAAGGHAMTTAPTVGKVPLSNGSTVAADAQLFGRQPGSRSGALNRPSSSPGQLGGALTKLLPAKLTLY